ncbi:aldose 1-epimerase family protein [Hwangdonia seohaensis]|uniref:Aldose 1-epimerase family protein n=1 Tax=Hwangdonia seohaensis TaxID=1240727 RepID=A0ABW3RAR6_9FLAO|nr:aldose 1-epimerase family protein [Hwangdonia seohaensis]
MHVLQNNKLKIAVKNIGAELCDISSTQNKTQFMWDANPNVWGSYAPNLFPIIGALKDGSYIFEDKKFSMPKHGFIRHNNDIFLHEQTENSLTFALFYDDETLKNYPFKFEFYITYLLVDNKIDVIHRIKNVDDKTIYFSVGGHPAFKCPVFENEIYEDYSLEFEHTETAKTHLINMKNGLISSETETVLNSSNTINLTHNLFNRDALVFKDLRSRKVTLKSQLNGELLSVSYHDFPYLGIWAKPEGDYVCIEPWLGVADSENTNQDFKTKEGIIALLAGKTFKATYTIEVNNTHLV